MHLWKTLVQADFRTPERHFKNLFCNGFHFHNLFSRPCNLLFKNCVIRLVSEQVVSIIPVQIHPLSQGEALPGFEKLLAGDPLFPPPISFELAWEDYPGPPHPKK